MFVVLVLFRVIAVYPNLTPYKGSVDIAIYVSLISVFCYYLHAIYAASRYCFWRHLSESLCVCPQKIS